MNNSHTIDITYIEGYATQRKKRLSLYGNVEKAGGIR